MKRYKWLFLAAVLTILGSCTTSKITSTWRASDTGPKQYNKIMVLGIVRNADRSIREKMEGHLVGDLKNLGYNALSAFQEYGPKAFQDMTEEQANKKLKNEGIDAVLTIVLLDKEREKYYVPGRVMHSPYFMYHDRVWGYYRSIYTRIETPGYFEVSTRYFWESNFYDLASNRLIYSVQTQSFDPTSTEGLAHEYGQMIVQSLVKTNVIRKVDDKPARAL